MRANLFIIGAMKAGSSSLFRYLGESAQIGFCEPKEPMFFSDDPVFQKGYDWYHSLFPKDRSYLYYCDGSTNYSKSHTWTESAERIFAYNPDAKFVYLVRDPFDRLVSQYKHMVRTGVTSLPLKQEILANGVDYLANGYYQAQIQKYAALFPAEQIRVLDFSRIVNEPEIVVNELLEWLSLPQENLKTAEFRAYNQSPKQVSYVGQSGLKGQLFYRIKRNSLKSLLGTRFRAAVRKTFSASKKMEFAGEQWEADSAWLVQVLSPVYARWNGNFYRKYGFDTRVSSASDNNVSITDKESEAISQLVEQVERLLD